ncbi:hypothetical protein N8H72_24070 [Pseudomonas koreensis]|uniref:hypothetical protein n=1 Tax=Pseudomonas koreensis TaxID=198620 RepID=UPI0021C64B7F|nr:hypothetical protein [Pseudomonas koreensis]MCU0093073.1 hypothetical protein [Pseudomonas koreensis]
MSHHESYPISWVAPILPSVSLAGISLGSSNEILARSLDKYLVCGKAGIYRFEFGPDLHLAWSSIDGLGDGGYRFSFTALGTTSFGNADECALYIMIRGGKVYAIKVYAPEYPNNSGSALVYQGKLSSGFGLGDSVSDLSIYADLGFDEDEEWFVSGAFSGLEISGWGVPLEDYPEQIITAIAIV